MNGFLLNKSSTTRQFEKSAEKDNFQTISSSRSFESNKKKLSLGTKRLIFKMEVVAQAPCVLNIGIAG